MNPPQSEERETLGEDIARLVDKRISKNELVLELVALFHRNNNVMPSHPDTLREREIASLANVGDALDMVFGAFDAPQDQSLRNTVRAILFNYLAQERERWESELRKEIVRLGTYDENNKTWLVVYTKEFTDSLISNKGKE